MANFKYSEHVADNANLLLEWDWEKNEALGLDPYMITIGSEKAAWWICPKDHTHSWKAKIRNRTRGQGCLICSNRQIQVGVNDLATRFPQVVLDWDYSKNNELDPTTIGAGSNKRVHWKCHMCGYEWATSVCHRVSETSCPACSESKRLQSFNKTILQKNGSLGESSPSIAEQWHPTLNGSLSPNDIAANSHKKVWWLCPYGHSYKSTAHNRSTGYGCPQCAKELQTSFPEQAIFYYVSQHFPDAINQYTFWGKELDIYIPSCRTAIEYDGQRWHQNIDADLAKNNWCIEKNIKLIRIREPECPTLPKSSCQTFSISSVHSNSALEEAIIFVLDILTLHSFDTTSINLQRDSVNVYAQMERHKKQKSLQLAAPELSEEWDFLRNKGLTPDMFKPNAKAKVWWIGKCGHSWQASISNRFKGRGCPICAGKQVLVGYNDFLSQKPQIALQWNYSKNISIQPDEVTSHSNKVVWWKCSNCGHEWESSVANISRGRGCTNCSKVKRKQKMTKSITQPFVGCNTFPRGAKF